MRRLVVVRLVEAQALLFLANETVAIWRPTFLYGVVRIAAIPLLSGVVIIAGVVAIARARNNVRVQATAAGAILASLIVWAVQWFWGGALFGWLIDSTR
jgi:hypothetical protein